MIRLALPNTPYIVPATGLPVEGRMKVFLHDTATYAELTTLEGEEYVQAANPQLLHAGLPFATLFTPLGVFDIVIEKYIGVPGEMSVYSPDSDFEQVGVYESGMDFDIASFSQNTVDTLEDLRDVDPALKMVTVKWYATPGDCPPRTYVWDAASENTEDGGYVVGSDVSDTGKWILMWDGLVLPCGVYGVKPGSEANIPLLLGYPSVVGSFQMVTAPAVRFTPGEYTANGNYSTSKELWFDAYARFTNAKFACPRVHPMGDTPYYLADFTITSVNSEARSSWFRTAQAFFGCGAKDLVIDATNHFTSVAVDSVQNVSNATITGASPFVMTFSAGRYIHFDNCKFIGTPLHTSNYYYFTGCDFCDTAFAPASASSFDFGTAGAHRIQADLSGPSSNTANVAAFRDADVYVRLAVQQSLSVIDLLGRSCGSFTSTAAVVRNIVCSGAITTTADITLENVKATVVPSGHAVVAKNCEIFMSYDGTVASLIAMDGGIISGKVDATIAVHLYDCIFDEHATMSVGQLTDGVSVTLERVTVQDHSSTESIGGNHVRMSHCTIGRGVSISPFLDSSDSKYKFDIVFDSCEFIGGGCIVFVDSESGGIEVKNFSITGCRFAGAAGGIIMPYMATDGVTKYLGSVAFYEYSYSGNTGDCPREKGRQQFNSNELTRTYSSTTHCDLSYTRVFNLSSDAVFSAYVSANSNGYRFGGYADGTYAQAVMSYVEKLIHEGELSVNNDQFAVADCWSDADGYEASKTVFFLD